MCGWTARSKWLHTEKHHGWIILRTIMHNREMDFKQPLLLSITCLWRKLGVTPRKFALHLSEEWKYCSIKKIVHYGILYNGLLFVDGPMNVGNPNCLFGKDNSTWRNTYNVNTCLESQYLCHLRLGHIYWNMKWFINSGILNFSGRNIVLVKHI